jgi:hypothetical protein
VRGGAPEDGGDGGRRNQEGHPRVLVDHRELAPRAMVAELDKGEGSSNGGDER